MTYNAFGQLLTLTQPVNATATIVTQLTYDPSNETLKTVTRDLGGAGHLNLLTQFGYDAAGNVNSRIDPRGNTWSMSFDALRRLTLAANPSPFGSQQLQVGYDANSNKTSTQRGDGGADPAQIYTCTYSLSDKVVKVTDPAGNFEQKTYDLADRLFTKTDAVGRKYQFAYDQLNRVSTVTDPTLVVSETRGYSPNGKLTSIQDANGNLTTFTFDGFDRLNKTIYPTLSPAPATFEQNLLYDSNGNVKTYLTRLGATITATYDALNRLSTKAPAGQPTESYSYDLGSRLLSITDSVLGVYTRNYDSAGRFVQEVYPDTKTVTSALDANGNVTRLTYPDGYFVDRAYDVLNRLTSVKLNGAIFAEATFSYDYLSRRTALEFGSLASSTYKFSLDDNLQELIHTFTSSVYTRLYSFTAAHQMSGQRISDASQSWQPASSFTDTYGDGTPANAANYLNEILRLNSTTTNFTYNSNGCMTGDGTWTHTYDTENHLLSSVKSGTSLALRYDPFHRQVQKSVMTTSTAVSNYVYSGWQRIADYDGSGNLLNRYVYGATMDEAIIQVAPTGVLTFLHGDHEGSIVATSDASGKMVSKNLYGLFGEIASIGGTTVGYTGQRFDVETGLYYYKRRYYSPKLGRFLQPDPIGYDIKTSADCGCDCTGGCGAAELSTLNLYSYVNNDPLNMTDPLGLDGVGGSQGGIGSNQGGVGSSQGGVGSDQGGVGPNSYTDPGFHVTIPTDPNKEDPKYCPRCNDANQTANPNLPNAPTNSADVIMNTLNH